MSDKRKWLSPGDRFHHLITSRLCRSSWTLYYEKGLIDFSKLEWYFLTDWNSVKWTVNTSIVKISLLEFLFNLSNSLGRLRHFPISKKQRLLYRFSHFHFCQLELLNLCFFQLLPSLISWSVKIHFDVQLKRRFSYEKRENSVLLLSRNRLWHCTGQFELIYDYFDIYSMVVDDCHIKNFHYRSLIFQIKKNFQDSLFNCLKFYFITDWKIVLF